MEQDPLMNFLELLKRGQSALGAEGQSYTRHAQDLGRAMGLEDVSASRLLNQGMQAADRTGSAAMSAYSDTSPASKLGTLTGNYGKAFMNQFSSRAPSFMEDMGNRTNAVGGMGDLATRASMMALAQGDPSDPLTSFARYLLQQGPMSPKQYD